MKMPLVVSTLMVCLAAVALQAAYVPPASNRVKLNFDHDWKFIRQDVAGADTVAFVDSAWKDVSLPHTYNDVDHYDTWVTGGGDNGYQGKAWYRKHFKLDATYSGRKVFLEFEGIRQAGEFYINGTWVGRHENGVGPCGVDITPYVQFGATDNVLAVKVDNRLGYTEVATGQSFQGDTPPFNPSYGGIWKNVYLHVTDKVYQTLPLYSGLGTSGTYIYATNINPGAAIADITAEAQVANAGTAGQNVSYQLVVVDRAGNSVLTKTAATQLVGAGQKVTISTGGTLSGIHMWAPDYPYLYQVYTILTVGTTVVDVVQTPFGIRKATFNVTDGLLLNGRPLYLKGYAPRSTMEWPAIGIGPNWIEEYDLKLMKDSNANFVRPMHVSAKKADIDAADRLGIVYAMPANDTELDATGRQWDQRVELMRDVTIYYRNNPSVLFYEAGNGGVSAAHMQQMKGVRDQWDPHGGRYAGDRTPPPDTKTVTEYWSPMDVPAAAADQPTWDAEYCRTESPRRVWDKYSPPSFGYNHIAAAGNTIVEYPTTGFLYNSSEDLARNNVFDYWRRWKLRGGQGLSSVMVGGAKIIFADSVSHGRMANTEVARVSGAVDGARLPKETFYGLQAAHATAPTVNIMGHWTYPAGTVKNVYVMANTQQVQLITYNSSGGVIRDYGFGTPANVFEFGFTNVAWQAGKIKAIGFNGGVQVASQEIVSAGAPAKLRLTPIVGPQGFRADGSDIVMFDVEVTDAAGNRCPTDEARVDFTASGAAATFLGGYNSGIQNSIYQTFLNTEAGINRVFARSTRTAGTFTVTASRSGLTSATASVTSTAFTVTNGITATMPQVYAVALGTEPGIVPTPTPAGTPTPTPATTPTPTLPPGTAGSVMTGFAYTGTDGSRLSPPMPVAHVVSNAQSGMQVYVDSSATFPTLPSYLVGGDYIQAFLRDAPDSTSTDLYQFFATKYSYIYQLIDSANAMPNHNGNAGYQWTLMPETVVINGRTHKIYKSRLMAPDELGYFASNGYGITLASGSNLYVVFAVSAEVQLQAPGQGVTASSAEAANPAANLVDGSTTTRWAASSGTFPQWIRLDLGRKNRIGGYTINWYNNATRSSKYKIELSDDDVTYALSVDRQTNTATGISNDRTTSLNAREGRYVRISVTGTSAGFASIYELQVVGVVGASGAATPTPTPTPTRTPTPTATSRVTPTNTATPTPTATMTSGSTLLSQGHPVVASANPQYAATNAVDGNMATRWASVQATDPQWIYVDLGATHTVGRVVLTWEAAYGKAYQIQTSPDAAAWTSIYTTTTGDGATDDLTVSGSGRYVRLYGTVRATQYGYSLWEFQVYGQ